MTLREVSKGRWTAVQGDAPTYEEIRIGALQRIADAVEFVAQDRLTLEAGIQWRDKQLDSWQRRCAALRRSNAALRGVITKLKARR